MRWWSLLVLTDVISALYLVNWGPFPLVVKELGSPTAYLNVYVHVPAAVTMYAMAVLALAVALWGALRGPSERSVRLMDFSAYSVAILAWYAFISGTIWAAESWGTPFALDPRQMSVLVLALIFSLYPAIRRGVEDPDRSIKLGQSYIIAGFVLAVASLLAPVLVQSLHPAPGTTLPGPLGHYMGVRIVLVLAIFVLLIWKKPDKLSAYIYLAGAAAALALMYPWFLYHPVRVMNVTSSSIILEDGRVLEVPPEQVLTPVFFNGTPTLPKNFVALAGGRVELVRHYSAYVNAALYFAAMAFIFWTRRRL